MAHGENAERHWGKEYWKSRLHKHGEFPGRLTKRLTHKKERRHGRIVERVAVQCGASQ